MRLSLIVAEEVFGLACMVVELEAVAVERVVFS